MFIFYRQIVFHTDVFFENSSHVKYHIPEDIRDALPVKSDVLHMVHSDTMLGHYFDEINAWLPFNDVHGSNTLGIMDFAPSIETSKFFAAALDNCYREYRGSRTVFFYIIRENEFIKDQLKRFEPCNLKQGEVLVFDPRVLHGTQENVTEFTRVSMDFRIIPVDSYDLVMAELDEELQELTLGDFYHEDSIGKIMENRIRETAIQGSSDRSGRIGVGENLI
ncbi:MAG: ectoine hydroxylase-related dioxygenase (phytanoyl-CoA dioxygenase family) [Cellvibrionaceae bacterium]